MNRQKDILSFSLLLFCCLFSVWLGIAGPLFEANSFADFFRNIKEWQTLLGTMVALLAAAVAWLNVSRQLRQQRIALEVTVKSREEERIEEALPGLQELKNLFESIQSDLANADAVENCARLMRARLEGKSAEAFVADAAPSANQQQRSEASALISRILIQSTKTERAQSEQQRAKESLHATDYALQSTSNEKAELELDGLRRDLRSLDEKKASIAERINIYNTRAIFCRLEIERFFKRNIDL